MHCSRKNNFHRIMTDLKPLLTFFYFSMIPHGRNVELGNCECSPAGFLLAMGEFSVGVTPPVGDVLVVKPNLHFFKVKRL